MDTLKNILFVCSFCASLFVLFYILCLISAVFGLVFKKTRIKWEELNPVLMVKGGIRSGNVLLTVLLSTAIVVGIVYMALSHFLASTRIGAFFEAGNYNEYYEAILYIKEKPVFCIVNVSHIDNSVYLLDEILLPYGRSKYIDVEYEPEYAPCNLYLGDQGTECEIVLTDIATKTSYDILESVVVSNYGELCGSKKTGNYHFIDCPNAKRINGENLVYFDNHSEADALGFVMCEVCADRY